jgi:signal transduction histidine kinase
MINCNYFIVSDAEKCSSLFELLKRRYKNPQFFYDKESLIKSIEFLSQNQSYIDNNMFVVFTETKFEYSISKYLRENLDDLNYILISFEPKGPSAPSSWSNVSDFIVLADLQENEELIFNRLESEITQKNRMIAFKLQIREFYEIGKLLSSERDIFALFDMIISTSLSITSSDAVTLYLVANKDTDEWSSIENSDYSNKVLKFVISKNLSVNTDFKSFSIPITKKSITGYTATHCKSLRIDDAYNISPEMEYTHDKSFDKLTEYKTISILSVPMKDRNNNVAGVIQLINKKKDVRFVDYKDENWANKIIPFDYFDELTMNSVAGQAAVALENNLLYKNINQLLQNYVEQNEKLTMLSSQILKAHEEERKRIAREIHDGPAQSVASFALKLELCKKKLQEVSVDSFSQELDKLGDYVRSTSREIRTIIYDLKPSYLDDGLFSAVQNHINVFIDSTGVDIDLQTSGDDGNMEYYLVSTIFRIVQESLTNIKKHANATKVKIGLSISQNTLHLSIEDNGKGFDITSFEQSNKAGVIRSFGIDGMKERVDLINGMIDINSILNKGTFIKVEVPLK